MTIWLNRGAGEILLGLPLPSSQQLQQQPATTRFRILGREKAKRFSHHGIWFEIDEIQELTLEHPFRMTHAWEIKPPTCLIRWDYIAYVQEGTSESPNPVGFAPNPSSQK